MLAAVAAQVAVQTYLGSVVKTGVLDSLA